MKARKEPNNLEGEFYKELKAYGKCFQIYYGYYEECDRQHPLVDPIPIYPDFREHPSFTDDGYPFVTEMQDACEHFSARQSGDLCYDCEHYRHGDEFLGICICEAHRRVCGTSET